MSTKKKIIFGTIIVLVALFLGGLFSYLTTKPDQAIPVPVVVNPQGDTKLFDDERFSITFQPLFNKYLILIKQGPFEVVRVEAETRFLQILELSQPEVCELNAVVVTTRSVDERLAGTEYRLSFCGPRPTPTPQINPNLSNLQFIGGQPTPGSVSIGTTQNGISLSFDQEVDISTVVLAISPPLSHRLIYHPRDRKIVTISPEEEWLSNTNYTIIINAGALSSDKRAQLKQSINLMYQVTEAVFPEDDHGEFITGN